MNANKILTVSVIFIALAFCQTVYKAGGDVRLSPRLFNYQGYLTDTLGIPITNPSLAMSFAIFDDVSGGSQKWSETQGSVSVSKGIFNVLLGSVTPIPDSVLTYSTVRYLQLTVAGQVLSPRTRIVSSAYAYTSTYSDTAYYALGAATDNDWQYQISDGADTTLKTCGRWGLFRSSSGGYGNAESTHVNLGIACMTGTSGQNKKYCVISGGYGNTASGASATVAGGEINAAYDNATVSGGAFNTASGVYSAIAGGEENIAVGSHAAVAGGYANNAGGSYAAVGGGSGNIATGYCATASGGYNDSVKAVYGGILSGRSNVAGDSLIDTAAVVVGGRNNDATAKYAFVGGGASNTASANYTTVTGGYTNRADSNYATVSGGAYNTVRGYSGTICGGAYNAVSDNYGTLGGGVRDTVMAPYGAVLGGYGNLAGDATADTAAVVVGGFNNSAQGKFAAIGGGQNNTAVNVYSTVSGGIGNTCNGYYSGIAGGEYNTTTYDYAFVGGGNNNIASGDGATVAGGANNTADGNVATVCGGSSNVAGFASAAVCGGSLDSSMASNSFTANYNSTVLPEHPFSAAFNGQTSTGTSVVRVATISKAAGTFTIDHPLDPENKILNHYFVESPEMVLIYRGTAVIGMDGNAIVHLPDYFDALNEEPIIYLTGIGTSDVYVLENVKSNTFVIGGKTGATVNWMVTGCRKDPSARITEILMPVEQPKDGGLVGRSLDDEFLVVTMEQLERMGKAGGFTFRHASEQNRYEEMKQMLEENGK